MSEEQARPEIITIDELPSFTDSGGESGVRQYFKSMGDSQTESEKRQLVQDQFQTTDEVIEPPYRLDYLAKMQELSVDHFRCCKAKSSDVAGNGWAIQPKSGEEEDKLPKEEREKLQNFFDTCSEEDTFINMMVSVMLDYEGLGNGYLEIARDVKGQPSKMWHIPATSLRVTKTGNYLQRSFNDKRFFQPFGKKFEVTASGTRSKPSYIDFQTGQPTDDWARAANEILHFKAYSPLSQYYGVPDFIPAITAMLGTLEILEFFLAFFQHSAVPQYAIVVEGGRLSDSVRQTLTDFFTQIKGKPWRTIIIPIPHQNVKVTFQKLTMDINVKEIGTLDDRFRDRILRAHGVPPARIGIIETAQLGSGSGRSQWESYKASIIEPGQSRLEHKINRQLIVQGFNISNWQFKFAEIDIQDRKMESDIALGALKQGAYTVNEYREKILDLPDVDGGEKPFIVVGQSVLFLDKLEKGDTASQDEVAQTKKAVFELYENLSVI